ncbi:hypothetical protein O3297_05285 [Janthinobacterium sp. SUN128]|uniref:Uncharacterized protein n=2 Tax=Oxalobacteraceae TaxID=75682 RepID=A0AAJ4MY11_9BURK|nr:hypothetical protein [Janthinobacterium sp. SUN128]KAB0327322.1 hypothetical protein F3B38_13830 [Janthinobacterium lividum]MDO8032815.1 hypothetical protein [Janthinobacterium sp. SUN128]QSX99193.1 hypothetical protein J3P46_13900 [Janthinobacterium lividum]
MAIQFNVNFNVSADELQGKTVLVFLKPQNPQRNYQIHAWQVLTGSAGATESFGYEAQISTDVSYYGVNDNKLISGRKSIFPGQLLSAVRPNGLSPLLQPASTSLAQMKLTPQQCGVINQTTPYIQFDSNWYVNDKPVVTMPYVDTNMTVSFEYLPNFYFMVATPPMVGQTYVVQNFSDMTQYVAPVTATEVDVTLSRNQGLWNFDFGAK